MDKPDSKKYSFFLKSGSTKAVLLIHGITGTPSEMRYLGRGLHKAGFNVLCNTLPGHCSTLGELKKVSWMEIADACRDDLCRLKKEYSRVFIAGISMGALLGIHLAYEFPSEVSGIAALAPTLFYDGWAVHKGKVLMSLFWHIPFFRNKINIRESWPYGVKDESLRENIRRFYKNADANKFDNQVLMFGSPFFPMVCLYQHHLFAGLVKKELGGVKPPAIIIHAREDDMTGLNNARFVFNKIGSLDKSLVILEDSYHMITIDKEKDKVVQEVSGFFSNLK